MHFVVMPHFPTMEEQLKVWEMMVPDPILKISTNGLGLVVEPPQGQGGKVVLGRMGCQTATAPSTLCKYTDFSRSQS